MHSVMNRGSSLQVSHRLWTLYHLQGHLEPAWFAATFWYDQNKLMDDVRKIMIYMMIHTVPIHSTEFPETMFALCHSLLNLLSLLPSSLQQQDTKSNETGRLQQILLCEWIPGPILQPNLPVLTASWGRGAATWEDTDNTGLANSKDRNAMNIRIWKKVEPLQGLAKRKHFGPKLVKLNLIIWTQMHLIKNI